METSLHRQLKQRYAADPQQVEVRLGRYRIDALGVDGQLIEIQHGSLAAIRDKIAKLLQRHEVLVVKPILLTKRLIKRGRQGGRVVDRRLSPKRGRLLDLFDELMYFRRVYPHPRLTLETPLVHAEEWRYPGHGKRRRRRQRDHVVEDQKLVEIEAVHRFRTVQDVLQLLPAMCEPFDTEQLAAALETSRWIAQRIAYTCRHIGVFAEAGKRGNARLYTRAA